MTKKVQGKQNNARIFLFKWLQSCES
jgi:hypothetical protein